MLVDGNTTNGNNRSGIRVQNSAGTTISNNNASGDGVGSRVQKSPPIATAADLIVAGNTASNNRQDLRVR